MTQTYNVMVIYDRWQLEEDDNFIVIRNRDNRRNKIYVLKSNAVKDLTAINYLIAQALRKSIEE